jgi:hypothetical protein
VKPFASESINFIEEDQRWGTGASAMEKSLHSFLTVTEPLAKELRSTD